jgi:polar amino acid transport system substrate-binding protein
LTLFLSCTGSSSKTFRIAIDPSWYPLPLMGQEKYVLGFSTDLLQEIVRIENIPVATITSSWNTLLWGLQEEHYEGMLSSLVPQLFNKKDYDFSELYLPTGLVLVVPIDSTVRSMDELKGKEIAFSPGSSGEDILAKYPGIIIRSYDAIPNVLADIVNGNVDGALIENLIANAYIKDVYAAQLKVATRPLTPAGLRLVTLHGKEERLQSAFNSGLEKLKKNGKYQELLKKWSLDVTTH